MQLRRLLSMVMVVTALALVLPGGALVTAQEGVPPLPVPPNFERPPQRSEQFAFPPDTSMRFPASRWKWPSPEAGRASSPLWQPEMVESTPDDYGYTWSDVSFGWYDAYWGIPTGITGSIESAGPFEIGFPFKFYENAYGELYVSRYGFVSFQPYRLYESSQSYLPVPGAPNDVIAAGWGWIGGVDGYVHYQRGGTAPNRWFVVEWNQVRSGNANLTFEIVLRENGDILLQYGFMDYSGGGYCQISGIEDSTGSDGLVVTDYCSEFPDYRAVRIQHPAPSVRLKIAPPALGGLTKPGGASEHTLSIRNTGDRGNDVYDFTVASGWPAVLLDAVTKAPLVDTDGDGMVDTGPLAEGADKGVIARVFAPAGASVGSSITATLTAQSSRAPGKRKSVALRAAVPAKFVQVYSDDNDGIDALYLVRPQGQIARPATSDYEYGFGLAVAELASQNLAYLWTRGRCVDSTCNLGAGEIYLTVLDPFGETVQPIERLTDHSGASVSTYDYSPALAVAPNGRVGVIWYQTLWDNATARRNYNIYFAILDPTARLIFGPVSLTNNTVWGTSSDYNVPELVRPRVAATTDNRFFLVWQRWHEAPPSSACSSSCYVSDIWYAIYGANGVAVRDQTKLTADTPGWEDGYYSLGIGRLDNNRVLLAIQRAGNYGDILYGVRDSSGAVVHPAQNLTNDGDRVWDFNPVARQLAPNRIALAWTSEPDFNPGEQGWSARYYNNETLTEPAALVRTENSIDQYWYGDSPGTGVNLDHFSARWSGTITVPADTYEFFMFSDDGSRLWVDGRLVLDRWTVCCQTWKAKVVLSGGAHQVRMEMHEVDGWAGARLSWRSATGNQIRYAVLDENYNQIVGPVRLPSSAAPLGNNYVSLTSDDQGRGILTWMDSEYYYRPNLYYSLIDANGGLLTPPTIFRSSNYSISPYVFTSFEGYGNTTYSWEPPSGVDSRVRVTPALASGAVGGTANVVVQLDGRGGATATGVRLIATMDPRLVYHGDTSGTPPTISGNSVIWNLPNLSLFERREFTLSLSARNVSVGTLLPVQLQLSSNQSDIQPADNQASFQVRIDRPLYVPMVLR